MRISSDGLSTLDASSAGRQGEGVSEWLNE